MSTTTIFNFSIGLAFGSSAREFAESDAIDAQAFTREGKRKLLLINKRNREVTVVVPKECLGATIQTIGGAAPDAVAQNVGEAKVRLKPFAVSVVALKD